MVLSSNTKGKTIDVLFDIDPKLPDVLVGDALRLQQVLINLGGNAIKFTEAGQVIVVLEMKGEDASGVTIEFAIHDSGIGIAPEHQELIFEAFSQAEASTTRRFGGTGLGLAISKHLVDLMGGGLQLESALGKGTTFRFQIAFPVPSTIPEDLHAATRREIPQQRHVLIVDDNPRSGKLLHKMVQSEGWASNWFSSGADALEHVQTTLPESGGEFPFSLVLIDWQMPAMDGWDLARQLRSIARQCVGAQPLLIMLSSNGRQDLALRSEEEQSLVDGFLVKPVTSTMILDAVLEANTERSGIRRLAAGRSSKRQLAGMRILVVEDNLLNQQVAEELLSNEGALVSLAANGQIGVEAVQSAVPPFDVVLMDIQMPVMDGYQATSAIRNRLGLTMLPIIAMTANAMVGDREACIAAGMNEHIGKPFDMAKLISLLIRSTGFVVPVDNQMQDSGAEGLQDAPVPQVSGLDLSAALLRMSNSHTLYQRSAQEFLRTLSKTAENLRGVSQALDRRSAIMTLHTLKGNAGTLGLTELAKEAGRLEYLLATDTCLEDWVGESNELDRLLGLAASQLEVAISMLQPTSQLAASSEAAVPPASTDRETLVQLLVELSALAKNSDMQMLEFFALHRLSFEALPENICNELGTAMQEIEFDAVQEACLAALEVLRAS